MKATTEKIYEELFERYPVLEPCKVSVREAFCVLLETFQKGGKLFLCGNGGSASDCEHIVGELMKSFKKKRPIPKDFCEKLSACADGDKLCEILEGGLPAISLTSHLALSTAFQNDKEPKGAFAQQLFVLGTENDALLSISTSGNSVNCVYASEVAKAKNIKTLALTGKNESKLSEISTVSIRVPETETYKVQELHLPIYHCLCAMLEEELF